MSLKTENFVSVLQNIGLNIVYDGEVFVDSDTGMLVFFDDDVELGFDRECDWSVEQLRAITRQLTHNTLARDNKHTLVRIKASSTWQNVTNLSELLAVAYHVVKAGKVIKEGSFKLVSDNVPLISRDSLIRTNESELFPTAPGRDYTKQIILPVIRDIFRAHIAYWGWFYPTNDDPFLKQLESIRKAVLRQQITSKKVSKSFSGSVWLKSFIRSYWHVDKGPVAATQVDNRFESVLKYRLGLNNSKLYDYVLSDGTNVSVKETFDINIKNVRFGFIVQRNAVSWFPPSTAADIYNRFVGHLTQPRVWDPSSGFSARLMGFAAACPNGTYIGCEPAAMTYNDLMRLIPVIKECCPNINIDIRCEGSENTQLEPCSLDLVFTSPPYFDKEKYFNEPGQCWLDNPTIDLWSQNYLLPTFQRAFNALKPGAAMVINIDKEHASVIIDAAKRVGFIRDVSRDLHFVTGRDHFSRKAGYEDNDNGEPVFVFIK